MKSKEVKLVIIDGCGSELLDAVQTTVNYELSGDGAILVHTDDLNNTQDTNSRIEKIQEYLDSAPVPVYKPYEGLILLRR